MTAGEPAARPSPTARLLTSAPARLVILGGGFLVLYIGLQLLALPILRAPPSWRLPLISAVRLAQAAIMIFAWRWAIRRLEHRPAAELGRPWIGPAVTGAAVGLSLFAAVIALLLAVGVARVQGFDRTAPVAAAAAMAVGAGVGEEIIFRGAIFRIVEEVAGTWAALAVSAVLFGLAHALNPGASLASSLAVALEAGVLLGLVYAATRSLWAPIGLHFGWDFAEGGLFGQADSGHRAHGLVRLWVHGPKLLTGGAFGPEASLSALGLCLAAAGVFGVIAWRRRCWRRPRRASSPPASVRAGG